MKQILLSLAILVTIGAGCNFSAPNSPAYDVQDLSNQGLTSLPSGVLEQTFIVELDISNNQMTGALPAEIKNLSNLRVLDASDNQFTGVPAEIGQLENLEVLDFSNNQLTGLPYELGNLTNLQLLDLAGNDISEADIAIIQAVLPPDVEIRL